MTQRLVGVTDVASAGGVADFRVRERTVDAVTAGEQYVIPQQWRVPSFIGMASTFRTITEATTVAMTTLSNAAGSGVLVAVREIEAQGSNTATGSPTARPLKVTQQAAVPTNGLTMGKVSVGTGADAAETSNASVVVKASVSADGGAVTAITLTLGSYINQASGARNPSAVGQVSQDMISLGSTAGYNPYNLGAPTSGLRQTHGGGPEALLMDSPFILRAGESLAVSAGAASATVSYCFCWLWEEYTLP